MAASDKVRFNIPVEQFLIDLLKESYPDLNLNDGSAIHDLIVRPIALMLQPHRDYIRVMSRNLKLRNFQVMNESEMDSLASNFLVSRRDGAQARGVQRVFFSVVQPVNITTTARFLDSAGRVFVPSSNVFVTEEELEANFLPSTAEYYVDVPVVSVSIGEDQSVSAGTVTISQGIKGATRTNNELGFTSGQNRDSNTDLYLRIINSVVNRDLVKRDGIEKTILDNFSSVRRVKVSGFGDKAMTRDVVAVNVDFQELFRVSMCKKHNVPLNNSGEIEFADPNGNLYTNVPFVGAIYDLLDLDYLNLETSLDGVTIERVAVRPGHRIRLYGNEGTVDDTGDYTITRVITGPVEFGGENKMLLLTDRPFNTTSLSDDQDNRFKYTIIGPTAANNFHIGGKIDVYVDSSADIEKAVVVGKVLTDAAGVAEIPIQTSPNNDAGVAIFEDGIGFELPVLTITKIEQLEIDTDEIIRELTPNKHYALVRASSRAAFATSSTKDVIVIRDPDTTDGLAFAGARLRVTYLTNADYNTIDTFLKLDENRDVTKDIQVVRPLISLVNLDMSYTGPALIEDIEQVFRDLVLSKGFDSEITISEIISLLHLFGVTDIKMPVTLLMNTDMGDGNVDSVSSQDRVSVSGNQVFRPAATLSIRKLG
jgi:hypothetical protein